MSLALVDISFPAHGDTVLRDHGYALYSAISRAVPAAHGASWLGIHGLEGKLVAGDLLDLKPLSWLRIRAATHRIADLLGLAGAVLDVAGREIRLGPPTIHPLVPAATLDARLVVIRLTGGVKAPFDPSDFDRRFEAEAQRQLARLGVVGELAVRGRRSVRVGTQRIIGHAVRVIGLSPEHSLILQSRGMGGKRRMGCGLFRPARMKVRAAAQAAPDGTAG